MGVYRRPHQPGHLSYDPSVAFPTRRTGATGATLRPRDPARSGGVTGEGTVGDRSRVVSRESPTLPSVSSAHTVLRSRRDVHAFHHFPLARSVPRVSGDTRPVVLQESAAAQEIVAGAVRRSCYENGGKRRPRAMVSLGESVRGLIGLPRLGVYALSRHRCERTRRKYRSVPRRTRLSIPYRYIAYDRVSLRWNTGSTGTLHS